MEFMIKTFLGKEVNIFPGDTQPKFGIVLDINPAGVVFEITERSDQQPNPFLPKTFKKGQIVFIAMEKLTFSLVPLEK